jgi:transcriptional regulator with XRE-family HTH domain
VEIEDQYKQFAKVVRDNRKRAGLKQLELAMRTNLTRSTIANIESGRQRVLLFEAMKISKVLNFSLDNLPLSSGEMPLINIHDITNLKLDAADLARLKKFFTDAARKSAEENR